MVVLDSFEKVFRLPTLCMRMNGTHPHVPTNLLWLLQFLFVIGIYVIHFSLLLNSIIYYDIYHEDKAQHVCRSGALLIICFIITVKYFSLTYFRKENTWLMKYIDEDFKVYKTLTDEEKNIVQNYADRGAWVCKLWFFTPFICGGVFTLRPIVIMIYYYLKGEFHCEKIFEYTYPSGLEDRKDEYSICIPMLGLNILFVLCAASMYSGFDSLAPTCMLHICGQVELVNVRIHKLFADETCDADILRHNLNCVIKHLQNIYCFVDTLKTTLLAWYEISLKVTTISIPFTALEILQSLNNGVLNIEFISMEFVCLAHMFVPCYYGSFLLEKGDSVLRAIYASGWESMHVVDVRRSLVIMMMRAGRPLAIRSVFRVISLDTFADMCRQSYAIFNIINATS